MTKSRGKSITTGATFVARLVTGEIPARRVANFMAESLDPAEVVCAAFERPDKRWQVDLHFRDRPEPSGLRTMIALAGGDKLASTLVVEKVKPRDWVKDSLIGLRSEERRVGKECRL